MWTLFKASSTKLSSDSLRIKEKLTKSKNHEGTFPGLSHLQIWIQTSIIVDVLSASTVTEFFFQFFLMRSF